MLLDDPNITNAKRNNAGCRKLIPDRKLILKEGSKSRHRK